MDHLKLAVATRHFARPLKQAVQAAAEIGFSGVQFDARNELRRSEFTATGRREFLHRLGEMGLSVASLDLPTRRSYYDQNELDARIAATKSALEFAFELKSKVLTARVGHIPTDRESKEYRTLVEVLNDLGRHGNHVGATLCLTPANDSPQAMSQLLDEVTQGPIGINFDPAAFLMGGHNPSIAFRTLYNQIQHVVVRDSLSHADGPGVEVPVGRGEVVWEEILALTHEADYRGWMTIARTAGDDKSGDMERAALYLKNVAMG